MVFTLIDLKKQFKVEIGLSDHSLGNVAALTAVALGAVVIEKHFKLKKDDEVVDGEFSMDPTGLKNLVKDANKTWSSLGKVSYELKESEIQNSRFKRSIFFVNNIKKDDIITKNDIKRLRPGTGIEPKHYSKIIGRRVNKNVEVGDPVQWDDIYEW